MRIYLDNNATTRIHPEVLEVLSGMSRDVHGNASSIHSEGQRARRVLEEAREEVASLIGAAPRELVFTSGGTESNNAAIHGAVLSARSRCHIVTSSIEHPSVLEPLSALREQGHEVNLVPPEPDGTVSVSRMIDAIRDDTRLVCLMLANNETGVIQPVADLAAVCRERKIHLHCDAVQGAGKIPVSTVDLGADTIAISAHKIHGPKGIGALYVRSGTTLERHMSGGAQERRRRAGTENVPLAAAFATAATLARNALGEQSIAALRDRLEMGIRRRIAEAIVHGSASPRLPNTSSVRFPGVDGESLVIALDLAGVAASTGAACSSGRTEPSHVLLAMGLTEEDARSSLRFSLSRFTTSEEIETVAGMVGEMVLKNKRRSVASPA